MFHVLKPALPLLATICMAFTLGGDKGELVKAETFSKSMDSIGLRFEMPAGYKETPVKKNRDLWYEFAIKHKTEDFEIRYSVWSLKPALEEYRKCKLDTSCLMVSPNVIYQGRIQSNVLNMTGGEDQNIGPFPPQAVRNEFNADKGGSSFFAFHCGFGTGYKYGQMVYLHKDNVADVIITYMSNDKEKHPDLMGGAFHTLKFK